MSEPGTKRRRVANPAASPLAARHLTNDLDELDAVFSDHNLSELFRNIDQEIRPTTARVDCGLKRSHAAALESTIREHDPDQWIRDQFPDLVPSIPPASERIVEVGQETNPFLECEDDPVLHPMLRRDAELIPLKQERVINAFIKVQWTRSTASKSMENRVLSKTPLRDLQKINDSSHKNGSETVKNGLAASPLTNELPPQFGSIKLNNADAALWNFFIGPLCKGRTVIETDNTYKQEFAPMAYTEPLVLHSILSLTATYVMDYVRDKQMQLQANYHQLRAVQLLGEQLKDPGNYDIEKGDAVVAALMLLSHNEIVNWEIHSHEDSPKWYRGGKKAELVLGLSNPAYKFRKPCNIQCTRARSRLGQLFCLDVVMSDCVYPLDVEVSKCSFPWLLNGTEAEQRKIVGMTGLCSKLMHYYAKITHLCARLAKKPTSQTYITIAKGIKEQLTNFWQWSDISQGHRSPEALMLDCVLELDAEGHVTTAEKVTELIAESYVASAQIYLLCRLFRRPRHDPEVQSILKKLLNYIDWQPTSGDLFTAQTPMFSVFIAGLVAYETADRAIISKWFEPIASDSRGNVPPAWRAMQSIWEWQDSLSLAVVPSDPSSYNDASLSELHPWWEDVVDALVAQEGRMNLS